MKTLRNIRVSRGGLKAGLFAFCSTISLSAGGGAALAQDDAVAVDRDGELVALVDVQQPARFGWDDDPPQIVDLADHTAMHLSIPPRSDDVVRTLSPRGPVQ